MSKDKVLVKKARSMRILFVAMPNSVHTARWINQLGGQGWDIHLFPAYNQYPHEDLSNITFHASSKAKNEKTNPTVRISEMYPLQKGGHQARLLAKRLFPKRAKKQARLASVIRWLKPDIIHSLEMQYCAYLTLEAKRALAQPVKFPPWLVSCWGNDIYLFGRLKEHVSKVKETLAECDYFTADCERDVELARQYGFQGKTFPALPVSGGFNIEHALALRPPGPPSARRTIALKGYQGWAGRALNGLRAIELCADVLRDYVVRIYFADPDVTLAAELASQRTGLRIEIVPRVSHEESLRMHGEARVSIGVSISDGLPLSTMEAALMGSFPVQTNTSCVGERLRNGVGTLLVSSDDTEQIAAALRRAITDDDLVDRAAELNFSYIAENLSLEKVKEEVIAMYERILEENPPPS